MLGNDAFASAASIYIFEENTMSANELPALSRALSVIVAIALVASAAAPLLLTAVRVIS
jgi:hypothetical protein